ncbi:putative transporter [Colletotrichum aenigma]|uniref:putative transporter n=1 Tax=Colletotrichum aenigma TaxID=1215731 RepID=UPI0018729F79|nr:putative transporter [Colletotrichum aenigma]KAF5511954.1 putative transporter [Colletotrichum aenigma]
MASPSAGPPSTTRPESKDGSKDDEKDLGIEPVTITEMGHSEEYTEEDYKKLTRKIDRYLIPTIIQALFGVNTELGLHGQQYQWLTTIFYITYLFGEFPSTWLLQRYNLGRVLTAYMIAICLLCISACNNWAQLMALRALQGFFECNISPGFLLITGAWYRTSEHAQRSLFWQSSQGFFTITCNLILIARVSQNQIGEETANKAWNWDHVRECFKDPQVYFGFFNTFLACIPNGGIATFSSLLYVTFGFDTWQSMLWGLPRNGIILPIPIHSPFCSEDGYVVMSLMPNTPEHKWLKWGMFDINVVFSLSLFLGWS